MAEPASGVSQAEAEATGASAPFPEAAAVGDVAGEDEQITWTSQSIARDLVQRAVAKALSQRIELAPHPRFPEDSLKAMAQTQKAIKASMAASLRPAAAKMAASLYGWPCGEVLEAS